MTNSSSETVTVRLVGGPDDWHTRTLDHVTVGELDGSREALGAYLISSHVPPGHPDPGARAVYEPNTDPWPANLWFFRGWIPWAGWDTESRRATEHTRAEVVLDADGLPARWEGPGGVSHRVERILVHWQSVEDPLEPDVWHVRAGGRDWELREHIARWDVGPLPDIPAQDHGDLLG